MSKVRVRWGRLSPLIIFARVIFYCRQRSFHSEIQPPLMRSFSMCSWTYRPMGDYLKLLFGVRPGVCLGICLRTCSRTRPSTVPISCDKSHRKRPPPEAQAPGGVQHIKGIFCLFPGSSRGQPARPSTLTHFNLK